MKKSLRFFSFDPEKKASFSINGVRLWWDQEINDNPKAKAIDEFEITSSGSLKGGQNKNEAQRIHKIWIELRRAHNWLKAKL